LFNAAVYIFSLQETVYFCHLIILLACQIKPCDHWHNLFGAIMVAVLPQNNRPFSGVNF